MQGDQSNHGFVQSENGQVAVIIDLRLYSYSAIKKTAHRFTGRCAVHLQQESESSVKARFQIKDLTVGATAIAEEFMNCLLDETLREQIARETEPVRNLILAHALSETALINPELEAVDPATDPLGIAQADR